jgi:hypothetical protein
LTQGALYHAINKPLAAGNEHLPPLTIIARSDPAPSPITLALALSNNNRSHRLSFVKNPLSSAACLCRHANIFNNGLHFACWSTSDVNESRCPGLINKTVGHGIADDCKSGTSIFGDSVGMYSIKYSEHEWTHHQQSQIFPYS